MSVRNFRKKPVIIQALEWTGSADEMLAFTGVDGSLESGTLMIRTLEGPLRAAPGDFIIKGLRGEFYPCKPDVFWNSYEEVL